MGKPPIALRSRRYLSYFFAAACVLWAARISWAAYASGLNTGRVLFVALLLWLAYGLAKLAPAALKTAGVSCLLGALFLPLALLNPFAVGDYLAQGMDPPALSQTLVWLVPTELFLLVSAYIFDLREPPLGPAPFVRFHLGVPTMSGLLKTVLFVGVGFAPIWVAIALIRAGGRADYVPADYWNVAPWLVYLAIPCCVVSIPIAVFLMRLVPDDDGSGGRFRNGRKW